MHDLLTNVRQLLLTDADITAAVGQRIRPHEADSGDGDSDLIILDLPDADQDNLLSGESIVDAELIIRSRSLNKTKAADIADLVHDLLHNYSGPAGTGQIIQTHRREFSHYEVDDEDDDDNGFYFTESLYTLYYQT